MNTLALICPAFFCPALEPNFWNILPGPLGQNLNLEPWLVKNKTNADGILAEDPSSFSW